MSATKEPKKPDLIAYVVSQSGEKSYYHRIGAAWRNSKGGARLVLEALPVNGEVLLLPPRIDESGQTD